MEKFIPSLDALLGFEHQHVSLVPFLCFQSIDNDVVNNPILTLHVFIFLVNAEEGEFIQDQYQFYKKIT
jgi:hypothetical protein